MFSRLSSPLAQRRIAVPIAALAIASFVAGSTPAFAKTAADICEAAKNKTVGKYAACRHKAEGRHAITGDAAALTEALSTCTAIFDAAWDKATDKAAGACPESPLMAADFKDAIDSNTGNISDGLAGAGLDDFAADYGVCAADLSLCDGNAGDCHDQEDAVASDLTTCEADRDDAEADLASCQAGLGSCLDALSIGYRQGGAPVLEASTYVGSEIVFSLGIGTSAVDPALRMTVTDPLDDAADDPSQMVKVSIVAGPVPGQGVFTGAPGGASCPVVTNSVVQCTRQAHETTHFVTEVAGDYVLRFEMAGASTFQLIVHAVTL